MDFSSELLDLVYKLAPGFFTAWVFNGLTAYKIKSPFERVIQALVYTTIIAALIPVVRECAYIIGDIHTLGTWTKDSEIVTSIVLALLIGTAMAYLANTDKFHNMLWKIGITNGSSYPSEWYKTLVEKKLYVTLHLKDGRRIMGWPIDWPDYCDEGQFVLSDTSWLDENKQESLPNTECIVIQADSVEFVEFLKFIDDDESDDILLEK